MQEHGAYKKKSVARGFDKDELTVLYIDGL